MRTESREREPCPLTCWPFSLAATQNINSFLNCEDVLLAHFQFFIHQYPQVFLCRAALNPPLLSHYSCLGLPQSKDLALGLIELHVVRMGPTLKPVRFPQDGMSSLQLVHCSTQLDVTRKPAESVLNSTVHVPSKDVKQQQSKY